MEENDKNLECRFFLKAFPSSEGIVWKFGFFNQNVPSEVIIVQLKSLLRNIENRYFDNFDQGRSS
ncbi:MAG: hypothetical protein WC595_01155 [Candidatus Nanoarchaeia archaeon]